MRRKPLLEILREYNEGDPPDSLQDYMTRVVERVRQVLGIPHPPKGMDPSLFVYSNAMGLLVGDRIRFAYKTPLGEWTNGVGTVIRMWFGMEEAIDVCFDGGTKETTLYPAFPSTVIQVLPEEP